MILDETVQATGPDGLVESSVPFGRNGGRPTGRISRRQWLDAALDVLVSEGIDAVRVNELARRLKISKSGFYWHFRDRAELLQSMKRYWVEEFSQQIISEVLSQKGPIKERLRFVVRVIREKQSSKLDLAFTSWAQFDPEVRTLVESVRDMRIAFISELLSNSGFEEREIQSRARLFVIYFSWSEVMYPPNPDGLEGEDLDQILDVICGA